MYRTHLKLFYHTGYFSEYLFTYNLISTVQQNFDFFFILQVWPHFSACSTKFWFLAHCVFYTNGCKVINICKTHPRICRSIHSCEYNRAQTENTHLSGKSAAQEIRSNIRISLIQICKGIPYIGNVKKISHQNCTEKPLFSKCLQLYTVGSLSAPMPRGSLSNTE